MQIFGHLKDIAPHETFSLTLGNFDGVHQGHQQLLSSLPQHHKKALITFTPHPLLILNTSQNPSFFLLTLQEEKRRLLKKQGVDFLIELPFSHNFSQTPADLFLKEYLLCHNGLKHIVVGHDFCFGKNRKGDFSLLEATLKKTNITCQQLSPLKNTQGQTISSSLIRNLLQEGNLLAANALLNYSYFITSPVIHGKKIGRTLKTPTANITPHPLKLLPKIGTYITQVQIEEGKEKGLSLYPSVTHLGFRPTVEENNPNPILSLESHLLNFEGDLYGKNLTIFFCSFLREEKKFSQKEDLIWQISEDIKQTMTFFEKSSSPILLDKENK